MTVITLSAPWQFALPVLCLCHVLLWFVARQLRSYVAHLSGVMACCPQTLALWVMVHAGVMALYCLAPAGIWPRCGALLFCLFIFRLTLTDQLTGLLPREMTVSCLGAGLLFALEQGILPLHLAAATIIWLALMSWRMTGFWFVRREVLGLGDVWMGSALGAWLGLMPALYAVLAGVCGFTVWLTLAGLTHRGGPVGPWLGFSALASMLFTLYQPVVIW